MLKQILFLGMALVFSLHAFALETKIVTFEQFLKLDTEHTGQMEFEGVSASTQAWTAIYVVGKQIIPNHTAQMNLVVLPEGLINKANPTEKVTQTLLIADDLPLRQKFSLKEFDDIADKIEDQTDLKIEDPIVYDNDVIRTYAQVLDWVPDYGVTTMKLSVGVPMQEGFEPLAIYVIVGEGDKPQQITDLTKQNSNLSAEEKQQQFRDVSNRPESMLARMEAKFLIFFVIAGALMFIYWRKWHR